MFDCKSKKSYTLYCESMRRTLLGVSVIMASFSDLYQRRGGALSHAVASLVYGTKYAFNPEARAQQIVQVAQNASVGFVKAFWSLSETHLMKRVPTWLCPTPVVKEEIFIPSEPIVLNKLNGRDEVEISVPHSHIPPAPVRCILISHRLREGQELGAKSKSKISRGALPPSRELLIHCHGGGFIAQSPEAHEIYLRDWAKDLDIPILSIDYSLAPGAPFPRAIEEVLLVYAWVLKNSKRLGSTGEHICLAGDSAGGNLMMGLTLKAIDYGIRIPDGVFCAYTPMMLDMIPSPSRLLCCMDPLLPLGFMLSCLDAYAGIDRIDDDEYSDEEKEDEGKKSGISGFFDSGISLIKDLEQMEVEGTTPPLDSGSHSILVNEDGEGNNSVHPEDDEKDSMSCSSGHTPMSGTYVSDFLLKYNQAETTKPQFFDTVDSDENIFYLPTDLSFSLQRKCCKMTRNCWTKVSNSVTETKFYKTHLAGSRIFSRDPDTKSGLFQVPWYLQQKPGLAKKFQRVKIITSNPFVSPFLASDEMLLQFPPLYIVSPSFDPTLDDSVMFAQRMKKLQREVHLDIVDKLPHGFLNFLPFSKEAHEGSKLCVARLKEALKLL
ncbi:hormone-sensitive lipase isoform X2 [Tachypleus tridentatus]|uniref:hormone-sensitive lipase isoform X2 n=1 Tax=Tachypleus tridentatus TaxID=6853 RepID=UPI003FD5C695